MRVCGRRRRPGTLGTTSWRISDSGAGEAIRTPDPNLGKVVLYP